MDLIGKILIDRLAEKGMDINNISAYIRNLANTLAANRLLSLQELNRRLQMLGWNDFELDDHTLQLIMASFRSIELDNPEQEKPLWFERSFNSNKSGNFSINGGCR